MLYVVHYTDRAGKPAVSPKMPESVAVKYAATVKGGKIVPCEGEAVAVNVTKCEAGTAEAQRASSRAFYAQRTGSTWQTPTQRASAQRSSEEFAIENQAEREAEAFGAARLDGCDPWEALDAVRGVSRR